MVGVTTSAIGLSKSFDKPKIVYPDITESAKFSRETSGAFIDCTVFQISDADPSLLCYLNSRVAWYFWTRLTPELRGGFVRLKAQYVSPLPLPDFTAQTTHFQELSASCNEAANKRLGVSDATRHRILDLAPPEHRKLTRKLEQWWTLDFNAFRTEVKRAFRMDIPVKERGEWENYLAAQTKEVRKLDNLIDKAEREIDAIVYRLFDLTLEEVTLLEASVSERS